MKQKWLELANRFDVLARRERGMITAAVLIGGGFLGYSLLVEPQFTRQAIQAKRIAQVNSELNAIETQSVVVQAKLKDPDAINRAALQQGRKDLAALDAKLRTIENNMVPPDKMQSFLESLLSRNRNLELVGLQTLAPTSLIERGEEKKVEEKKAEEKKAEGKSGTTAAPGAIVAANIYKHGVEIRIAGSYNDLLLYLAEIERMPQRIIWNRIKLTTDQYPRNEMTLTVYTLSLDKQWLVV